MKGVIAVLVLASMALVFGHYSDEFKALQERTARENMGGVTAFHSYKTAAGHFQDLQFKYPEGVQVSFDKDSGRTNVRFCDVLGGSRIDAATGQEWFEAPLFGVLGGSVMLDIQLDACFSVSMNPCTQTVGFSFNMNKPLVLRPRLSVANLLNINPYELKLEFKDTIMKEWELPQIFNITAIKAAKSDYCTNIKVPNRFLGNPDLKFCVVFPKLESIDNGVQMCPLIKAFLGDKLINAVSYKQLVTTMSPDCKKTPTAVGCECIPMTYAPLCEFAVRELGRSVQVKPDVVSSFRSMDSNNNFGVQLEEFVQGRAIAGVVETLEAAASDFNSADVDHDGTVNIEEFKVFAASNEQKNPAAPRKQTAISKGTFIGVTIAAFAGGVLIAGLAAFALARRSGSKNSSLLQSYAVSTPM